MQNLLCVFAFMFGAAIFVYKRSYSLTDTCGEERESKSHSQIHGAKYEVPKGLLIINQHALNGDVEEGNLCNLNRDVKGRNSYKAGVESNWPIIQC